MSSEALRRIGERAGSDLTFRQQFRQVLLAALGEYDLTDEERRRIALPNFGWLAGLSKTNSR